MTTTAELAACDRPAGIFFDRSETTNSLTDEIVYELYGLTDEEIEIVEEAVGA